MKLIELSNADGRKLLCEPQDVERFEGLGFYDASKKYDETKTEATKKTTTRRTTRKKKEPEVVEDESAN